MSSFDPTSFLSSTVTGANDTVIVPVPRGQYMGIIEKVTARQWNSKDGTKSGIAIDVQWIVEDAQVKAELARDTVTVKQGIMLDTTPEGQLDVSKGKNIGLGRLRDAVGRNDPNVPFSFDQLPGSTARILVDHRPTDDGSVFAEVKAVSKL